MLRIDSGGCKDVLVARALLFIVTLNRATQMKSNNWHVDRLIYGSEEGMSSGSMPKWKTG